MSGNSIRQKFLDYMKGKGHEIVPSSALVPENDPTTLFTGSGMQPMVPYLLGETHPKGTRIVNSQKCFRAEDIEEVGDNRHTTFFEMLGNWSLGDYFKEEQIPWFYEFLVDELGLNPEKVYVTAFIGDEENSLPKDTETVQIWQKLFTQRGITSAVAEIGTEEDGYKRGIKEGERIFYYDSKKNWWSRAGVPNSMPAGEIGGPDSEVFYDFGTEHDPKLGEFCHPNCDCGRFMEIGNSVFMEYIKTENGFEKLPTQNVDFGGGLERIAAAVNDTPDMFEVDLLGHIIQVLETFSEKEYAENKDAFRIIADHIRGATFMISDGVLPGNTEQGYFVRRLLRRAVRYADVLKIPRGKLVEVADTVVQLFGFAYPSLEEKRELIKTTISGEEEQFRRTLEKGLREFEKLAKTNITGRDAFVLFTTYGFPFELTKELANEAGINVDETSFQKEMKDHQEKSRTGAEQKFKGGLADHSEKVVQYHTITHLLLAGLRKYLGDHVHQAGSNITGERLRFDFTHDQKLTNEEKEDVANYVNNALSSGGKVDVEILSKEHAQTDDTIEASFWDRYPDEVKVYTMKGDGGQILSRELCGGPHVDGLEEISGKFFITKEESSAAGIRRIKGVLE
ncbi:alanine--tRNA ligase [bacterium]|nr:alanine--tRNA ligase [bacterium]